MKLQNSIVKRLLVIISIFSLLILYFYGWGYLWSLINPGKFVFQNDYTDHFLYIIMGFPLSIIMTILILVIISAMWIWLIVPIINYVAGKEIIEDVTKGGPPEGEFGE